MIIYCTEIEHSTKQTQTQVSNTYRAMLSVHVPQLQTIHPHQRATMYSLLYTCNIVNMYMYIRTIFSVMT